MPPAGKLSYARHDANVFVRIEGRGTHVLGPDLDHFLTGLCARGDFAEIVVDLTAAEALDSTMLGLLARIAKWMRLQRPGTPTLLCAGDKIAATIRGVGLDRLFTVVTQSAAVAPELSAVPSIQATATDRARTVLAAHRELMALNAENASQFQSVVEFLERDLEGK